MNVATGTLEERLESSGACRSALTAIEDRHDSIQVVQCQQSEEATTTQKVWGVGDVKGEEYYDMIR